MRMWVTEKKGFHQIHIVLDASKVVRCDWCGSPQSDKWIHSDLETFCSEECSKAESSQDLLFPVFVTLLFLPVILAMWMLPDSVIGLSNKLLGVVIFIIMEMMMIAILLTDYKNRRFGLEIPKGSRSHIGVSKVSLLQRVSAPVDCPRCGAKINLKNVGEDMIYTCPYCGVNGVVEIEILE